MHYYEYSAFFSESFQGEILTLSLLTDQPSKMSYVPVFLSCQGWNKVIW